MGKLVLLIILLVNLSSARLNDVCVLIDGDVVEVGNMDINDTTHIVIYNSYSDSLLVTFRLSDELLGTRKMPIQNVILCDTMEIFELEFVK